MLRIQNIRYLFLLLLLATTALSYLPVFANVVILEKGQNPLNRYIVLLSIITFLLHLDYKKWIRNGFLKLFLICTLICLLIGYLLQQMEINSRYFFEGRNILISFVFLAIGYNSRMTLKMLGGLVLIFSIAIGYATYLQLFQHAGGFVITDQYISYGKNIMGMMCVSASLALAFLAMNGKNKVIKYVLWGASIFLFILTVAIRARGSFISLLLVVVFIVYKLLKDGKKSNERIYRIVFLILGMIIVSFVFTDAFRSFGDFFMSSLYKNREEDLLTGRGSINNYALSFFERNPLFGSLSEDMDMTSLVHNFLLRQLASFGIIGSFPIVLLYIYMLFYIVKVSLKSSVNITNIGFFVFLFQLIISLVEPTFPFAPGTGVVFSYILLGYSLYQRSIIIE